MKPLGRLWDRALDWRYNINTRGIVETDVSKDSHHASTVSYRTISYLLDRLKLAPHDVLIDIGSGKGRVLVVAARRKIQLAIGIDASSIVVEQAEENCLKARRMLYAPVEVHQSFAEAFDYSRCTAGYCFNAFGSNTLRLVLQKIRQDRHGKPFRLCFLNATPEHMAVFQGEKWRLGENGAAAKMPFVVQHQIC